MSRASDSTVARPQTRPLPAIEKDLEAALGDFKKVGLRVGALLEEVRQGGAYKRKYSTFERYCHERWGISYPRAKHMREGADVMALLGDENLSNSIDFTLPENVEQARALAPVAHDPVAAAEVMAEASQNGKPTAAKIGKAAKAHPASRTDSHRLAKKTQTPRLDYAAWSQMFMLAIPRSAGRVEMDSESFDLIDLDTIIEQKDRIQGCFVAVGDYIRGRAKREQREVLTEIQL
jgi:hypothetical protein